MDHFYKTLSKKEQEFIDELFNTNVTITEKMDGGAFSIEKNGSDWVFYKRNAKEPINVYDRTINQIYEPLINFFESKKSNILNKIPDGYRFEMEYIKVLKPNLISYDELPQNNLVLHSISIYQNGKLKSKIEDIKTINKFAKLLEVSTIPVIFQGKLDEKQKAQILEFLKSDSDSLIERFKTESFTQYIFTILDPSRKKTYLQKDLSKPIEGIVFYFNEKSVLAKLVDPTFEQSIKDKKIEKSNDLDDLKNENSKLVEYETHFSNYISTLNISEFLSDKRGFLGYVETIGKIFLQYYKINKSYIEKEFKTIDEEQLDVFKQEEFKLNHKFLEKDIIKIFKSKPFLEVLYKFSLMHYRITRKRFTNYSTQDKEVVINLSNLLKENKFLNGFTDFINESLLTKIFEGYDTIGSKECNLIIGKFQPFTLGHMKMVDKLYSINKLPTYIVSVRRKDPIISESLTEEMFKLLLKNYPKEIAGFSYIDKGLLGFGVGRAREHDYETKLIGCGSDRVKDYERQLDYILNKGIIKDPNVRIIEIERGDEDISATKVRESIVNDDMNYLKTSFPKCLFKLLPKLKLELIK